MILSCGFNFYFVALYFCKKLLKMFVRREDGFMEKSFKRINVWVAVFFCFVVCHTNLKSSHTEIVYLYGIIFYFAGKQMSENVITGNNSTSVVL